jgi:hypothetical protein
MVECNRVVGYLIEMIPQGSGIWKVTNVNDGTWRDVIPERLCAVIDGTAPDPNNSEPHSFSVI